MQLNPQAVELNDVIKGVNTSVLDLLSPRGKAIYFPKKGILSQSAEAAGKSINATIGTALEDDGQPMCLEPLVAQFTGRNKAMFNYAPSFGRPDIRQTWKDLLYKKNPSLNGCAISQPVVTNALTHGLSMAGYLFTAENDTVITPDMYWENYDLIFNTTYGARIETFPAFVNGGFNTNGLRQKLLAGPTGKKVVILNFPNNPTGYTVTDEEGREIRDALVDAAKAGYSIVVIIDDAYFGLVFEPGIMRESMFTLLANAHERILAVKLDGPTKEDFVWGFRVGFVTFGCAKNAPALYTALENKLAGAVRGTISNASNVSQTLLLAAYKDPSYESERASKCETLKRRYEKIKQLFALHPEYSDAIKPLPFNSGYFMCVKVVAGDAEKVRQVLLAKYSVGVIAFGDLIRLAFSATPLDKIETLLESVYKAACEAR